MIVGIFVGIILICVILMSKNKHMVYQEVKTAYASTKEEQQSFEIWTIEGNMERVMEEVIPNYKKAYPQVRFKIKAFKKDIYDEMILNAARTNSLPDMFYSWGNERLSELVALDVVMDLTDIVLLHQQRQMYEGALESYTVDEKIYGLPAFGWNSILYCNTELFTSCNIEPPTTYEAFIEAIKGFKKQGVTPILISGNEAEMASLCFMELALNYVPIQILDDLRDNPKYFGVEGFGKTTQRFKEIVDLEPWQVGFENDTSMDAINAFIKGEGAMLFSGSWASRNIDDIIHSLVKGKVKAISFPRKTQSNMENGQVGLAGYADGFVLNKHTSLEGINEKILFIQMMKEISDSAVIHKGMGIPVYRDQSLEGTKYGLLKQCQSIFLMENYGQAYDYILDSEGMKVYHEALLELLKGQVDSQGFIKKLIKNE